MIRRVSKGDPLSISADTFNGLLEMLQAYQSGRFTSAGGSQSNEPDNVIVRVKNTLETDQPRFSVLCIQDMVFTPTNNIGLFKNLPTFAVGAPESSNLQKFVILAEPVRAGKIGLANIVGVCAVQVSVTDETHQFATPVAGQTIYLQGAATGPARILYKESGTGTKWGAVQFPVGGSGGTNTWCRITDVEGDAPPFLYSGVEVTLGDNGVFATKAGGTTFDRNVYNAGEYQFPGCGKVPIGMPVLVYPGGNCWAFSFPWHRGTYG